jgi:hypothetical protein
MTTSLDIALLILRFRYRAFDIARPDSAPSLAFHAIAVLFFLNTTFKI